MKNIKDIKKGAILINTARGGLIDTKALLIALEKNIISAAGIDVLEEEYALKEEKQLLTAIGKKECNIELILEEHMLMNRDDVIVTPHNAFNTYEALQRILDTTLENVKGKFKKKVVNEVKLKK